MARESNRTTATSTAAGTHAGPGGLAGWILARWRNRSQLRPRLVLVERITLAPRQTLCLVEAEGRRFLIVSSPEGSPAFYPIESGRNDRQAPRGRVS